MSQPRLARIELGHWSFREFRTAVAALLLFAGCSSTPDPLTEQYPFSFERASGLAVGEPAEIPCDPKSDFAIGGLMTVRTTTIEEQIDDIVASQDIRYDLVETSVHPNRPLDRVVQFHSAGVVVAEIVVDDVSVTGDGTDWMSTAIQACRR